ncbi:MAG TPA: histidine phosphatase family protein [Geminicoccaceae bacterium]
MDRRRVLGLGAAGLLGAVWHARASGAGDEAALWQAIRRGEAAALIRHALAPGTGDPANFQIDDCATQRTLSDEGRAQARAIGARFRANGVAAAEVRSSQWCRCLETAELLGLGPVEAMPALNSFFGEREKGPGRTATLRRHLGTWAGERPLILVTHQVNITALTGVYPASGEIVVVRADGRGSVEVAGTSRPSRPEPPRLRFQGGTAPTRADLDRTKPPASGSDRVIPL